MVSLALLALIGIAGVRPPPAQASPVESVAQQAAYAHGIQAEEPLRQLAEWSYVGDEHHGLIDVWIVADEVLAKHSHDAAVALARAAPAEHDPAALVAWLASRKGATDRAAARATVTRAEDAMDADLAKAPLQALEAELRAADVEAGTVLALRRDIALGRIDALRGRFGPAGEALVPLVDDARRLGWTWGVRELSCRAARMAFRAGDLPLARRRWDRALLDLSPATPAGARADILNDLAAAAMQEGAWTAAETALLGAIGAYPATDPRRYRSEANLADLYLRQRHYALALGRLRAAQAGLAGAGEEWKADLAFAWTVEARLLATLGRWSEALARYREALAAHEKADGLIEREAEANCHANMARVLTELGRYAEARQHEKQALDLFETVLHSERRVCDMLRVQAERELQQGRADAALAQASAAAAKAREIGEPGALVWALVVVGRAHLALGHPDLALPPVDEALRIAEAERDPLLAAEVRGVGAKARRAARDAAGAVEWARRGGADLAEALQEFGDESSALVRAAHMDVYEVGALAAADLGRTDEVAWFLDRARASVLVEALGGLRALATLGLPEDLARARAEAEAAEARAEVAVEAARRAAGPGARTPELTQREREYEQAKRRHAELEDQVQARQRALAGRTRDEHVSLAALRKTLREVEDLGTTIVVYGLFETEAMALVVRPEGARLVPLKAGAKGVRLACEAMADESGAEPWAARVAAAREALVTPLALGPETKRLLVSPDGAIAGVPFRALLTAPGEDARTVAFIPSASAWMRLREEGKRRGEGVLALGGCDYGARYAAAALAMEVHARGVVPQAPAAGAVSAPDVTPRSSGLPPLAMSEAEARAIGTEVLVGPRASVPVLREHLARSRQVRLRAVHLACHGLVDDDRPSLSALALTATEQDDGFLKVHDILGLDLSADLVTLSACSTARGPEIRGEGLYSVARAFLAAGAPRVVASLWKVDDQAAAAFMRRFHALYREGVPASEALRRTQVEMREGRIVDDAGVARASWKEPRAWAAWVLWGVTE